jgi:tetratricopeptide (TPR) repeat protein
MRPLIPVLVAALLILLPAVVRPQTDPDTLREAKTLFFDREYEEARETWQEIHSEGNDPEARTALYWIARCSEKLGESERALEEYGAYLDSQPSDRTLREEAKTSRVALAAKLYKTGKRRHIEVLHGALHDSSRTVRYFAALQMASLGPEVGRPAVPVLQEILRKETDEDLVDRAKLALLRLDRTALAEASPASNRGDRGTASWIRVRIWKQGARKPQLSLNLPVFLADMVFNSLPDEAREDLREEGFDAESFWERLKKSSPTDILTIEGEEGGRMEIWIE